jgi:hypothetical protein
MKIPYSDTVIINGRETEFPRYNTKDASKNNLQNLFDSSQIEESNKDEDEDDDQLL